MIKDLVLKHFRDAIERSDWHPALSTAVEGLKASHAAWKPDPARHSIWQIVRHLTDWKRAVLQAWDGDEPDWDEVRHTDWQEILGDDAAWEEDVRALHDVSAAYQRRIEAMDDDELRRAFPGEETSTAFYLMQVATHDVYHAGQIRYLRALQWGLRLLPTPIEN